MAFEGNNAKRRSNIDTHDLDFEDADLVFEKPHIVAAAKGAGK